jgi:DegV family protein with EDD domain
MAQVRVVTDSAADLPPELVAEHGITVVPLSVHFGEKTFLDGETITPGEFYHILATDPHFPRTSQPSVGRFEEAYARLRDEGAEIISIHLSSHLSGTFNAAGLAARSIEGAEIHLVDSLQASMLLGELALEAARLKEQGRTVPEVLERVENLRQRLHFGLMLDNLTHIQRGGRIGRAQGLLGTLLSIKPILSMEEGVVVPRQRVRTTARALQELANEAKGWEPLAGLRVMHADAPKLAEDLVSLVRPFAPGEVPVQLLGPVIGTHVGAGAVGVISIQAEKKE